MVRDGCLFEGLPLGTETLAGTCVGPVQALWGCCARCESLSSHVVHAAGSARQFPSVLSIPSGSNDNLSASSAAYSWWESLRKTSSHLGLSLQKYLTLERSEYMVWKTFIFNKHPPTHTHRCIIQFYPFGKLDLVHNHMKKYSTLLVC